MTDYSPFPKEPETLEDRLEALQNSVHVVENRVQHVQDNMAFVKVGIAIMLLQQFGAFDAMIAWFKTLGR